MDVSTIHKELNRGVTRKFYIFTGDEWAVQQIYIDQIVNVLKREFDGIQYKRIDEVSSILTKLSNNSFIKTRTVYVVRDDKTFINEEKLQDAIMSKLGDNILVFLWTVPDKRTKFYKKYTDDIAVFEPLKEDVLKKYVTRQLPLNDTNCTKLIQLCEYDYGRCLLETDKVKQYMDNQHTDNCNNVFTLLLKDNVFYKPPKDAVFDLVDAILDWQPKLAFDLYEQCLAVGEATLVIISNLYNNAKAVLQVQSCEDKDIAKTTGLTGWQIANARKHLNVYSISELLYIMELCVRAEQGIKTGKVDEKYAVEYIMVNVMY